MFWEQYENKRSKGGFFKKVFADYLSKVLFVGTGVLAIGAAVYFFWQSSEYKEKYEELVGTETEFKKLNKKVGKLKEKYRNQKELNEKLKEEWSEEKDALKGKIKMLSDATYGIRTWAQKNDKADIVFKDQAKGKSYIFHEIHYQDEEGNKGPPIGYVMIFESGKVVSKMYNHDILVKQAVSRNMDSGKYTVLSKAFYILRGSSLGSRKDAEKKDWKNKKYGLPIEDGEVTIDPTEPANTQKEFHLWAPNINGGLNTGVSKEGPMVKPSVGVSLSGYGRSKRDLDWKFLQLGTAVDSDFRNPDLHIIPFTYRPMPSILRNSYIGPGVGVDAQGNKNYFLNFSVGF